MVIVRTAAAVVIGMILLIVAPVSLAAFALAVYLSSMALALVSKNEALQLAVVIAGIISALAAAFTLVRFLLALVTPRLILPRCFDIDKLENAEKFGLDRNLANIIRHVTQNDTNAFFDLVAITSQLRIGSVLAWNTRILVVNPSLMRIFSEEELTAVLLHECGHVQSGLPLSYVIARQISAARALIIAETDPASTGSLFHKFIDIASWLVLVPVLRSILRGVLYVSAVPLLGITTGLCYLMIAVFRRDFHSAEFAADAFVRVSGHTEALARALLKLSTLDHVVQEICEPPFLRNAKIPEMPAVMWPRAPQLPEPPYYELPSNVEQAQTAYEMMPDALSRVSTTHPAIASRIERLGPEAVALVERLSMPDMVDKILDSLTAWPATLPVPDNAGTMTLGIVDTRNSLAFMHAVERLSKWEIGPRAG